MAQRKEGRTHYYVHRKPMTRETGGGGMLDAHTHNSAWSVCGLLFT